MTISKELLDELLKACERPEDLLGDARLMKDVRIKLMERMLGAELTAHLGYEDGRGGRNVREWFAARNQFALMFEERFNA
tara:strand:- start:411 stop:650 length:240 start_codon:yes stop_codon:yes gene_type:complete